MLQCCDHAQKGTTALLGWLARMSRRKGFSVVVVAGPASTAEAIAPYTSINSNAGRAHAAISRPRFISRRFLPRCDHRSRDFTPAELNPRGNVTKFTPRSVPKANAQIANRGPAPEITILTKTGGPLAKRITLSPDGRAVNSDGSACPIPAQWQGAPHAESPMPNSSPRS